MDKDIRKTRRRTVIKSVDINHKYSTEFLPFVEYITKVEGSKNIYLVDIKTIYRKRWFSISSLVAIF